MTTFVLIHGAWLTPRSWEGFEDYLSERGHEVIVPAWPGHDRPVEEIRADPSPIDGLTLQEIVDHYADVIRDLSEQPVLVGHSFGALIVQLLLDRGFGAAGWPSTPPRRKGFDFRCPHSGRRGRYFPTPRTVTAPWN